MMFSVKQKSTIVTLPSPVGGWNARDSLIAMGPADAVTMENWWPMTTECRVRAGYSEYATGLPAHVESLMVYAGGSSENLFAASDGDFYDISSPGAVGAAVVTGQSNSRWQWANIATAGGNFMYCANALDKPLLYDGSAWTPIDGVSTPAITGVTTTTLDTPIVFKNRVWFIQRPTLKTWYLPVNAVGGAANAVDMSAVAQLGGFIVDHATWTIDAGQGVDDYYVAVTSMGEIIVYQGTDPSSASTWALKGVWRLGRPIGRRCLFKLGGDLILLCGDGLVPMASALQSSRVDPRVSLTDKIQQAVNSSVTAYGGFFGWQMLYFAGENMLILNVPVREGSQQQQYVMNTITKSWSAFNGWEANCWAIYNNQPYFGGNEIVGKAWDGNSDAEDDISAECLQSFNNFGTPNQKRFTMMQPLFRSSGQTSINCNINVDFSTTIQNYQSAAPDITAALWDTAIWDESLLAAGLQVIQNWLGANGLGRYAAVTASATVNGVDNRWVSTTLVFEPGGVL